MPLELSHRTGRVFQFFFVSCSRAHRYARSCAEHPRCRLVIMDRLPPEMVKIIAAQDYAVDEVTVATPPSWLAAMPDCLSMPDFHDKPWRLSQEIGFTIRGQPIHKAGRMSLVVSERACVVKV